MNPERKEFFNPLWLAGRINAMEAAWWLGFTDHGNVNTTVLLKTPNLFIQDFWLQEK
jgi:hypothetical protein